MSPARLPFDVPFVLISSNLPKEIVRVELQIRNKKYAPCLNGDCGTECVTCSTMKPKLEHEVDELKTEIKSLYDKKSKSRKFPNKWRTAWYAGKIKRYRHRLSTTLHRLWPFLSKDEKENKISEMKALKDAQASGDYETDRKADLEKEIAYLTGQGSRCACANNCSDIDKICITVCPWQADLFSASASSPVMRLDIPPLKANQEYSFFYKFYRKPTSVEKKDLAKTISYLYATYINGQIQKNVVDYSVTQVAISNVVKDYYKQKLNEDVSSLPPILSNENTDLFTKAIKNETYASGPDLTQTIYTNLKSQLANHKTNADAVSQSWKPIGNGGGPLYITLNKITSGTSPDAKVEAARDALKKLQGDDLEIEGRAQGQVDINGDGQTNDLEIIKNEVDVQPYLTNLSTTINVVKSAADGLKTYAIDKGDLRGTLGVADVQTLYDEIQTLYHELRAVEETLLQYKAGWTQADSTGRHLAYLFTDQVSFSSRQSLNSNSDFETRTEWYVSGDLGLAYVAYERSSPNQFVPYFGINFNLFPINRQRKYYIFQKPYGCRGTTFGNVLRNVKRNLSVVTGVTVGSASGTGIYDTFSGKSLLTGLSLRIFDPVRLTAGTIWNKVSKNYPLSTDKTLSPYFYVSLSFDLDVKTYLGKLLGIWGL